MNTTCSHPRPHNVTQLTQRTPQQRNARHSNKRSNSTTVNDHRKVARTTHTQCTPSCSQNATRAEGEERIMMLTERISDMHTSCASQRKADRREEPTSQSTRNGTTREAGKEHEMVQSTREEDDARNLRHEAHKMVRPRSGYSSHKAQPTIGHNTQSTPCPNERERVRHEMRNETTTPRET